MEMLDMCDAMSTHQVQFILNPSDEWASFPPHLKEVLDGDWGELKYFTTGTQELNPEIQSIPNNKGGIYTFVIKPNIIPQVHLYIVYIGRAKLTDHQNLRKRVGEYAKENKRPKICKMKSKWSPYLYLRYLPLDDNDLIDELERELIKTVLPPFNDQFPDVYNQAVRAAF